MQRINHTTIARSHRIKKQPLKIVVRKNSEASNYGIVVRRARKAVWSRRFHPLLVI